MRIKSQEAISESTFLVPKIAAAPDLEIADAHLQDTRGWSKSYAALKVLAIVFLTSVALVVSRASLSFSKVTAIGASFAQNSDADGKAKPNVVFFFVDDQGFNDVGYNTVDEEFKKVTPFLDSLASSGIKLSNYYTEALCTPARAALLTGKNPIHTGLNFNVIGTTSDFGLPEHHRLMSDFFKDAGYSTKMIGKWHLGFSRFCYLPTNRGFDSHVGFWDSHIDYITKQVPFDNPQLRYFDFHNGLLNYESMDYAPQLYMEEASHIIRTHDPSQGPFFLYYAQQLPHSPLETPPTDFVGDIRSEAVDAVKDDNRRMYAEMSAAMDVSLESLVGELKTAGLYDNTLIVYASDNGGCSTYGASSLPLRGGKNTYFEGGFRSNAFLHGPGVLPEGTGGTTYSGLVHVVDWLPTLMGGLLGESPDETLPLADASSSFAAADDPAEFGNRIDGMNLWEAVLGSPAPPFTRQSILHNVEFYKDAANSEFPTFRAALRDGPWKLVYGQEDNVFWYDTAAGDVADRLECLMDYGTYPQVGLLFHIDSDPEERADYYYAEELPGELAAGVPEGGLDELLDRLWATLDAHWAGHVPSSYTAVSTTEV
ncbi:unnamed protein product, partial [Heterosigma akashiwo]